MTNSTGAQYYENYIGNLSVADFIEPHNYSLTAAINEVVRSWVWDVEIPGDFEEQVRAYGESQLAEQTN